MKQILSEIIKEWQGRKLPEIIQRDVQLEKVLNPAVKKILSVVGFRRVGKTYILLEYAQKIGQQNCVYLNLEDERLPQTTETLTALEHAVREHFGDRPLTILIDEIQNIPQWSLWARRMNETTPHQLVISGSSSKLALDQIPTEMRGRTVSVRVYPLNFREFLRFKGGNDIWTLPEADRLYLAREYVTYGGLPEVVLSDEGRKILIADEYFHTFVLRDLIQRHRVRKGESLRKTIRLLLNSTYYTLSRLEKILKDVDGEPVGRATISRYVAWLEESYFLRSLEIYNPKVRNRLKAARKVQCIDTIFLSRFATSFSDQFGRLLEATASAHLQQSIDGQLDKQLYYFLEHNGSFEVDYIVQGNQNVERAIQVSYATTRAELAPRELRGFEKLNKLAKVNSFQLVTWNFDEVIEQEGYSVMAVPLWKWLLL